MPHGWFPIVGDTVVVIPPRPVGDFTAVIGKDPGPGFVPMVFGHSQVTSVLEAGHHARIDAVGIGVNVERLLAAVDGVSAEVGFELRLHVVLEFRVGILAIGEAEDSAAEALAERVIGKPRVFIEDADVDVAVLPDIGAVGVGSLHQNLIGFRAEFCAGGDRLADGPVGVVAFVLLGGARRASPGTEDVFPVAV